MGNFHLIEHAVEPHAPGHLLRATLGHEQLRSHESLAILCGFETLQSLLTLLDSLAVHIQFLNVDFVDNLSIRQVDLFDSHHFSSFLSSTCDELSCECRKDDRARSNGSADGDPVYEI